MTNKYNFNFKCANCDSDLQFVNQAVLGKTEITLIFICTNENCGKRRWICKFFMRPFTNQDNKRTERSKARRL